MRLLGSMLELGNSMGLILEARSSLFFFLSSESVAY